MSSTTLNAVAIDVIGQYGLAGKHLVQAYRLGTERIVSQMSDGYAAMIRSQAIPAFSDSIRDSLVSANQQLAGFVVGGVARATEQADLAIDRMTISTTEGLKRLGGVGERIEAIVGTPVVDTMTKVNMPAAQMSLQIASRVVDGSKALADRVGGADDNLPASVVADVEVAATQVKARAKRAA